MPALPWLPAHLHHLLRAGPSTSCMLRPDVYEVLASQSSSSSSLLNQALTSAQPKTINPPRVQHNTKRKDNASHPSSPPQRQEPTRSRVAPGHAELYEKQSIDNLQLASLY